MLINKSECRKYLLEMSQSHRGGKFKRVGQDVFEQMEYVLRREMREFVKSHPSIGKTLMVGSKTRKPKDDNDR